MNKMQESCDPDARWLKKGKRFFYGYKIFVSVDAEAGFVDHLSVTPANRNEAGYFAEMLEKMKLKKERRVYADKDYASQGNRELLKNNGLKDGLMKKGVRGKALRAMQKIKKQTHFQKTLHHKADIWDFKKTIFI